MGRSDRNRHKEPDFGLVETRTDPQDLRRGNMHLTTKGHALAQELAEIMERRGAKCEKLW
jgi:DNA-binding MarR family transcriptional regulator